MDHLPRWRVVGLGSPYGDDSIGWQIVDILQQRFPEDDLEFLALDRPGPGLIHSLQEARSVLLVDAAEMGAPPGTVSLFSAEQLLASHDTGSQFSIHSMGVAETLALASACRIDLPPVWLLLVQLESLEAFANSEIDLSPAITRIEQLLFTPD